tara:strand:+ start:159 stop:779 length:621 start_codon:yes stop_codon:yes gene_type:complete
VWRRRRLALSPGDGGGAAEGDKGEGKQEAPAPAAGKKGPDPVPYDVFKTTNTKMLAAEARAAKLQAKLDGFGDWKAPADVESLLEAERAKGKSLLLLADKGVDPKYRDYVLNRLTQEGPDDPGTFLDQLRESESAFFGSQSVTPPPVGKEPRTPPKSNPDKGGGSAAPGDGRAVSAADIDGMTSAEYSAWKQAGGLDRLRNAGAVT